MAGKLIPTYPQRSVSPVCRPYTRGRDASIRQRQMLTCLIEEPRRSGRATKGQHKNASSSPAPPPKPAKTTKSKPPKKSLEPTPTQAQEAEDYGEDEEDEKIRCICGDENPKDKRAFIGCDLCGVWQHNVCMGIPDDEDEIPNSYNCEECEPNDHKETLRSKAKGERIWEWRNKVYASEKKRKAKAGMGRAPGWLKKDVLTPEPVEADGKEEEGAGSKRKRGQEVKEEVPQQQENVKVEDGGGEEKKPTRGSARQDKRRKSAPPPEEAQADPDTALIPISQLPTDRQKIATALSKIFAEDVAARNRSGTYRIPDGQTSQSLGDFYASRLEYAMRMNHESEKSQWYKDQFRALFANLKKNALLISRLLDGSLTPDELSTMSSADMASEELQRERQVMKEQLDRQAVAVQQEGPRFRRTHKGDELIEDVEMSDAAESGGAVAGKPVRERTSVADAEMGDAAGSPVGGGAMSPTQPTAETPLRVDTKRRESMSMPASAQGHERRQSSQQFDMNNIWAKTAQSPTSTSAVPRPMQMPPRRRSSQPQQQDPGAGGGGTKDDADIDRMLQDPDDEETYSPADFSADGEVIWRGKLIQSADSVSPTVNARFVAGRDLTPTIAWKDLLPEKLSIDGRLAIARAEEYLCSLQWSQSTDISVLALTPYDDAEGFEAVFSYFKSRQRYGVVKNKPSMIKDLYIIPVEQGQELPDHVGLLEFCRLKPRVEERCLLASVVVGRATEPTAVQQGVVDGQQMAVSGEAVNGHHTLPQHMRSVAPGPSGSPINATFSPSANNGAPQQAQSLGAGGFPPNPYTPTPPQQGVPAQPHPNPLVNEILGSLQYAPTAMQVVAADPDIAREKLVHLRQIMEDDLNARTDINALAKKLFGMG